MTINKARPSAGRVAMAALLALSLVAAACAGSDSSLDALDEPEAASASRGDPGHCTVPDSTAQSLPSDLDGSIQPDPQLEISQLDNGLTVYVRENDSPGQRGQFALVIRAGSVLESDDQSGAAHFLEHMLFNGTDRWPGNEMVEQLQRFGSEIGPDINAWTSYDETVYWLELPDVDDETIELASDILLEWASRATVEQSAVEDERGVVVEERRLTDEGAEGRIGIAWNEMTLEGSPFEGRSPIGELESIESMDRERGKRPSSRPARNTTGYSRPLAACSVMSVTRSWELS